MTLELVFGLQHRMPGAQLLFLSNVFHCVTERFFYLIPLEPNDDGGRLVGSLECGLNGMPEHRLAANGVKHFEQFGPHARPFPCGK